MNIKAYYNEYNRNAAAWLRELIKAGLIADGEVDERSIEDVVPNELIGFTQCHFFAGIGVWSYALRQAGWPDDRPVWTGSCPCQPFSTAGKGAGFVDERHLWPALFHLIAQCKPSVVFGEQVASKDGLAWLDLVQADLEGADYAVGAVDTCAAGFGAPHIRQRLYWVADAEGAGEQRESGNPTSTRIQGHESIQEYGQLGSTRFLADAEHNGHRRQAKRFKAKSDCDESRKRVFKRDSTACSLADAASDRRREGQSQPRGCASGDGAEGAIRRAAQFGVAGKLDYTVSAGLERLTRNERDGDEPGRQQQDETRSTAEASELGGVVYTSSVRQFGRFEDETRQQSEVSGAGCESVFAGKPAASPLNGFWADADWLFCRDGKWRSVESGSFPLVDGAPARVGRLRGYGNSLVAPQAQAFIEAYMEIKK